MLRNSKLARALYYNLRYGSYYCNAKLTRKAGASFAQGGEDTCVERLVGAVKYFIDIGANDGITFSNTFYFAVRGAAGICFEPTWQEFTKLSALYRFSPAVRCENYGISDVPGTREIVSLGGLSYLPETKDPEHSRLYSALADQHPVENINLRTFREAIADKNLPDVIDLLSVDVEGHELNVLRSVLEVPIQYRCVIVETHVGDEWRHRDWNAINELLLGNGYRVACETWVNTLYVNTRSN